MREYFLEFRLMARWKFANRTTLLHEVVHFFLDFRFRIARELQGSQCPKNARGKRRALPFHQTMRTSSNFEQLFRNRRDVKNSSRERQTELLAASREKQP